MFKAKGVKGDSISQRVLRAVDRMERHRTLRWGAYSVAVGLASGLMACTVFYLLEWSTFFAMENLAGYHTVKPAGEHLVAIVSETPLIHGSFFSFPPSGDFFWD